MTARTRRAPLVAVLAAVSALALGGVQPAPATIESAGRRRRRRQRRAASSTPAPTRTGSTPRRPPTRSRCCPPAIGDDGTLARRRRRRARAAGLLRRRRQDPDRHRDRHRPAGRRRARPEARARGHRLGELSAGHRSPARSTRPSPTSRSPRSARRSTTSPPTATTTSASLAKAGTRSGRSTSPTDIAGLTIAVGSGTNQEKILLAWDQAEPGRRASSRSTIQYFQNDPTPSWPCSRAGSTLSFGPNADRRLQGGDRARRLQGRRHGQRRLAGHRADRRRHRQGQRPGARLHRRAERARSTTAATRKVLERWGLSAEAIDESETNPPGLAAS